MTQTLTTANRPPGRRIAIASGKGGVGKTWLAITMAHALARAGQRVLLFDGDLGLANVDTQLGITPKADIASVVGGTRTAEDAILSYRAGFDILPGRSGSTALAGLEGAALDALNADLRRLAGRYNSVVMDLGAGVGSGVRGLAAAADLLLVVVTDEPTSLTDAYAVLKLDSRARPPGHGDAAIVVNHAASKTEGQRTYHALARACATFLGRTPQCAGIVRRDEHVKDAIRRQMPLLERHPVCAAAADVEALARAL
jgi:flagellar biosynthesis protein FlhG